MDTVDAAILPTFGTMTYSESLGDSRLVYVPFSYWSLEEVLLEKVQRPDQWRLPATMAKTIPFAPALHIMCFLEVA